MAGLKISLITVCYNAAQTIEDCITSVLGQTYSSIEYIIIDGASTDGTADIINKYRHSIQIIVSEPDGGLYQAMNKGIALATGEVIGILNADDLFTGSDVIQTVAQAFETSNADTVYGDIDMVNADMEPKRQWRSGVYKPGKLRWGWMPPHTAFFLRRDCFERFGNYDVNYGTAADYELMLRMLFKYQIKAVYLPKVLVKMRLGGASNGTLKKRIKAWRNDYKAMKKHGLPAPLFSLLLKPLRKLKQYLIK